MSGYWLYVLSSVPRGTLYIGVTNDLVRRVHEQREGSTSGFTSRYKVKMLVYYERHETAAIAIQREKNMKHWPRKWKVELVESMNPAWAISQRIFFAEPHHGSPGQARR